MNFFTEKLAGRGEINLIGRALIQPPKESYSCKYELSCPDVCELKKLKEEKEVGGRIEDLQDWYEEVCSSSSAAEDCSIFKKFEFIEQIGNGYTKEYYESHPISTEVEIK